MKASPCVNVPASFAQRSAPRLGDATSPTSTIVTPGAALPASTPLARPDPTAAWYDLSTVANVMSIVGNLLRS